MADASVIEFERHRRFLTGLAYRMLGSLADAQDIVQDAFLRWHRGDIDKVDSPRAWLARVVTRLCLDFIRSARVRRESYVGPWLPEPILEAAGTVEPAADDRIDAPVALLLALERLSPLERAAFVLHDLLDMDLAVLADAIDRNEAACRQLLVRARRHVGDADRRVPLDRGEADAIATAFFEAVNGGDGAALTRLLADGARFHSDGGGKVRANMNVIEGAEKVRRFFVGIAGKPGGGEGVPPWSGPLRVNGLPGFVSLDRFGNLQVTAIEIVDGRIDAIYIVRNPDKLAIASGFLRPALVADAGATVDMSNLS